MKNLSIILTIFFVPLLTYGQKSPFKVNLNRQLSSSYADYAPRLVNYNSKSLIFTSSRDSSVANIFFTTKKNSKWKKPIPLIESDKKTSFGVVSFDSARKVIFFTKCYEHCEIYYSFMHGELIGEPIPLNLSIKTENDTGIINSGHPCFSNKFDILFFVSNMPGGYGKNDIWFTTYDRKTDTWSRPQNAGPEINTSYDEIYPFLADDGTLYFSSSGHQGLGGWDIFKAVKKDKLAWGNIENMGEPINSNADDFGIIFTNSLQNGFFSSNRTGGLGDDDIYEFFKDTATIAQSVTNDVDEDQTIGILTAVFNKEICTETFDSLKITGAKVFPNPTDGEFAFEFNCNKGTNLTIRVYSNLGQLITKESVIVDKGDFKKHFNLKDIISGVYYIQVLYNCETLWTEKIVVNR